MSTKTYRQFRKISTGYEKLSSVVATMLPDKRAEHIVSLNNKFKNFVLTNDVFSLSKENISRLMDIQLSHQPMQSYDFIHACVKASKYKNESDI